MKKSIFITIACFLSIVCQAQNSAKDILDKTAETFSKNWGIKTDFSIQISNQGKQMEKTDGTISIKKDKFVLETLGGATWINGETQWTYVFATEEVNISNPTQEELQTINPYLLLNTYKNGYTYKTGKTSTYKNKPVFEVILTPQKKSDDIQSVTLYIQKQTYNPLYIEISGKNKNITKVIINNYKFNQDFPDSMFLFDKRKYPDAEEIDLR